jgi:predicted DNA binding CopG/RHH family protein
MKKRTGRDWLKESDEWDKKPLDQLWADSEPVDFTPVDKRPKKAISLRLDEPLIAAGKRAAEDVGVGYQTLFRMWLIEGLRRHKQNAKPTRKTRVSPTRRTGKKKVA